MAQSKKRSTKKPPRRSAAKKKSPTTRRRGPAPKLTASGERAEPIRDAVRNAAIVEFSEKGFRGTTVREIAARAGVNHGMVTYYFKSKEALWKEAVEVLFERLVQEVVADTEVPTTKEGLRAFARDGIRRYVRYCAKYPEHVRMMFHESVQPTERLAWLAENYLRPSHTASASLISILQEKGLTPNIPAMSLLYLIVGSAQIIYALAPEVEQVWGVDPRSEEAIEAHTNALIALVIP